MKLKLHFLFVFILGLIITRSNAQTLSVSELSGRVNTISTAVPFLMITPDSRAGGMGDAGVATNPDVNSMHWNVAKYGFIDNDMGVSLSYTPWLRALIGDINLSYLSFYKRLDRKQVLAASLRYFSLGNIVFTNQVGDAQGEHNPNELSLDVGYSLLLSKNLSGGIALRYIYSNLTGGVPSVSGSETHAGQTVAADLGFYYQNQINALQGHSYALGLAFTNLGAKISYTDDSEENFIPANLRMGGSYAIDFDDHNTVSVAVDVNKLLVPTPPVYADDLNLNDQEIAYGLDPKVSVPVGILQSFNDAPGGFSEEMHEITYSFGLEYLYEKRFALRTGYFLEHETKGNRKFFTLGVGLKLNVFSLDFAYLIPTTQRNPLENTLRFSLNFDFQAMKDEKQ